MNGGCYFCGDHPAVLESGMPRDPTIKHSLAVCQKKECREKVVFTKGAPNV
jgi:hypothetical protein